MQSDCDVGCIARSSDLVKKFDAASTSVKVVAGCQNEADAADSAANVISEFVLQVCCWRYLFDTVTAFLFCVRCQHTEMVWTYWM